MKTVTLIGGSPKSRADRTLSEYLIDLEQAQMTAADISICRVNARKSILHDTCQADFQQMLTSDALVLTFPLYFFCLPGMLMRFLQDYATYADCHADENKPKKIYSVVNCGFPEPELNEEAARVIGRFAAAIGADYRFSLLIGGGGMILGAKQAPFMRATMDSITAVFCQMRDDIRSESPVSPQDTQIEMRFPKKLYFMMGNLSWRMTAKREHKLRATDLRKRPYRD